MKTLEQIYNIFDNLKDEEFDKLFELADVRWHAYWTYNALDYIKATEKFEAYLKQHDLTMKDYEAWLDL